MKSANSWGYSQNFLSHSRFSPLFTAFSWKTKQNTTRFQIQVIAEDSWFVAIYTDWLL